MAWQIKINDVEARVGSGAATRALFSNLTGVVSAKTRLAILGQSGTGKSTLLDLIAQLKKPFSGTIRTEGVSAVKVGYVFQSDILVPWRTVRANLALASSSTKIPKEQFDREAASLLAKLSLNPDRCLGQRPNELSGGERRRVCLAMALISQPDLLVLDEPNSALDEDIRFKVCDYLSDVLESRDVGMILVTHDLEEAILLADNFLVLGAQSGASWLSNEVRGQKRSARRFEADVQTQRHLLASQVFRR